LQLCQDRLCKASNEQQTALPDLWLKSYERLQNAARSTAETHDERLEEEHCYAKKKGVVHSEIMAPPDVPAWVFERQSLWNVVEASEKRRDSQLARDFDLALPVELSLPQRLDLVRGFVQEQLVERGMVADFSIHQDNAKNPHVHIMTTMRTIDANGFGKKERDWNQKELLKSQREAWATHINHALENAGHQNRVDHRRLAEQAVTDRLPQLHLGVAATGMIERASVQSVVLEHPRIKRFHARQQFNDSMVLLNRELAEETARLAAEQRLAEALEDESERQAQADALAPLSGEPDRVAIAALDSPPIAPLAPLKEVRSDAALELLPVVADAAQPPMPLPTAVVLDAAAAESMVAATELKQPPVLSPPLPTDLPHTLPTPTVPQTQTANQTKTTAPIPTPALTASEQWSEVLPLPTATEPALLPVMVDQVPLLPVEPADLESLTLQPQRVAAQRHAWGLEIVKIAHLGLFVTGQPRAENGDRRGQTVLDDDHIYQLEWRQRDQTLMVKATDGGGVLVAQQGDTITLSDTFTEADWHCFQQQEPYFLALQTLQTLKTQPYRELWGREMAAVAAEAMRYARKVKKIEAAEHIEEGERYRVIQDGQTLKLVAMDERGLLAEFQGDQLTFVNEKLTETDHQRFQAQRQKLEAKQQKTQQPTKPTPNVKKSKGPDLER